VFRKYFLCHLSNHTDQFEQQWPIAFFQRKQRWDVTLRNDDDVRGPERARVVIGENVVSLANDLDVSSSTQHFVAVEIISH